MARDQQISEVTVARQQVEKVLELAEETGALAPALVDELPDLDILRVQVDRCQRELNRAQQRLAKLPPKARGRLRELETLVPDALLVLALYGEAERTLSMAEAIRRFALSEQGDAAVPALTRHETAARRTRLATGTQLAAALDVAMAALEDDPGGGWFSGSAQKQVRQLARDVRADFATLEPPALEAA